ncbi:hypothetical protein ABIA39_006243 [Nocardia sp. GAS34]|uniref:hypothetical protein n=1 Tax=unclassified Nocardia TaxID=2637762 RepID=UPI003D23F2EA
MDLHDMDSPAEVLAAAGRYHTAASSVAEGIARILRELTAPQPGRSPLDRELLARLGWITESLAAVADGHGDRVADTHSAATDSVLALEEADASGARILDRADPDG